MICLGDLAEYSFRMVSTAGREAAAEVRGERGEFSLLRSINKGKLIFGGGAHPYEGEGRWRNWFLVL